MSDSVLGSDSIFGGNSIVGSDSILGNDFILASDSFLRAAHRDFSSEFSRLFKIICTGYFLIDRVIITMIDK